MWTLVDRLLKSVKFAKSWSSCFGKGFIISDILSLLSWSHWQVYINYETLYLLSHKLACMYVCMHVCKYVCMYVCMYVYMYVCMHMHTCLLVCVCVCMCICMYVCMFMTNGISNPHAGTQCSLVSLLFYTLNTMLLLHVASVNIAYYRLVLCCNSLGFVWWCCSLRLWWQHTLGVRN